MKSLAPRGVVALVVVATAACARGEATSPSTPALPPKVEVAAAKAAWLCRPDRNGPDPCATSDLSATDVRPDGEKVVMPHVRSAEPKAECFYVYPTVDLDLVPGNHADLEDTRRVLATTRAQAARFTEACRLWVPLYHQVTLGAWLQPRHELDRLLTIAFADVDRAFREFIAAIPPSRPIVLVGHSQGAEMVVRLLRAYFDRDQAMRARLLLAMPIGGEVEVATGSTVGGTFENLPLCTRPLETGCIVAYRTHHARQPVDPSRWAPRSGHETACVDPSAVDRPEPERSAPHTLSRAYYPARGDLARFVRGASDVTTPFLVVRDFYRAKCAKGEQGYAYLAVDSESEGPVDLRSRRFDLGKLGLHVLDLQLPQGDLVDLVARRARSLP